jgi:hypothetical protein
MNLMQDLRTIHDKQRKRLRTLYDSILKDCTTKIRYAAQLKKLKLLYELPIVHEGLPLYDAKSCKRYLIKCLTAQGFECMETGTRFLTISWKSAVAKPAPKSKEKEEPKESFVRKKEEVCVPHLPPILGKDDLFALPSIRNLQTTARQLRK